MLFVNYISRKTDPLLLKKYLKQHRIFVTSMLIKQPKDTAVIISGDEYDGMFIEALTKLKEIKKNHDCPVFYLDNDCIIVNPVDELFKYDFDVAVVYRYRWIEHGGFQDCLGGFLFFSGKDKKKEDKFLEMLIEKTTSRFKWEISKNKKPWFYDQLAINDLVGRPPKQRNKLNYNMATPYEPQLKIVKGIKVLFLSANEWACPMCIYLPEKVKIIHYNHGIWPVENADGKPAVHSEVPSAQTVSPLQ